MTHLGRREAILVRYAAVKSPVLDFKTKYDLCTVNWSESFKQLLHDPRSCSAKLCDHNPRNVFMVDGSIYLLPTTNNRCVIYISPFIFSEFLITGVRSMCDWLSEQLTEAVRF